MQKLKRNPSNQRTSQRCIVILIMLVWLLLPFKIQAQSCSQQGDFVRSCASQAAKEIVEKGESDFLSKYWTRMVFYATADALQLAGPGLEQSEKSEKKATRIKVETSRTDKQIGSTASGTGSTTLAEKPGLPEFLSFAIEHGAIQKEVNGDSVTLSGSPYGLVLMMTGEEDTMLSFDKHGFWRRFGFSVNLNLNEMQQTSLGDIDLKQVSEYSVKVRLVGDRSTRSKRFQKLWDEHMRPAFQFRVDALSTAQSELINKEPKLDTKQDDLENKALEAIENYLTKNGLGTENEGGLQAEGVAVEHIKAITEIILKNVNELRVAIINEEIPISDDTKTKLRDELMPTLRNTITAVKLARENVNKALPGFRGQPLLTLTFTQHRDAMMSDYSELKLLFERRLEPLDFIANAGLSAYGDPDPTKNQSRIRDIHASLSLEGRGKNPFKRNANDHSKAVYSVSYRYERMRETGLDLSIAQAKMEFPIGPGVSIPFSITYANRTEFVDEKEVRANFGFTLDTGKLFALTRSLVAR